MKATRKLIPTIVLLLIAAVMFSTASYAWFAINETANTSGLAVGAKTANNLFVRKYKPTAAVGDWDTKYTITDLNTANHKLFPTHPTIVDGSITAWAAYVGIGLDNGTKKGTDTNNVDSLTIASALNDGYYGVATDADGNKVWKENEFFIKASYEFYCITEGLKDLTITNIVMPTIGEGQNLYKSLSMVIASNDGRSWTIGYKDDQWKVVGRNGSAYDKALSAVSASDSLDLHRSLARQTTATADGPERGSIVDVYLFFDGAHDECKLANYIADAATGITITFGLKNHVG